MDGLVNTLTFIQNNWSNFIILAAIIFVLYNRIKSFAKLSKEEKVDAALAIIQKELLKFMSEAEIDWKDYKKSGLLKKSDVITKIYNQFPILKEYLDQDELIQTISDMIDEGMNEMNEIINGIGKEETTEDTNDVVVTE